MIFDWLALNWIGLFIFSVAWLVFWLFLLIAGDFMDNTLGALLMVVALPCLWISNVPFWLGVVGLVCAVIQHFQ